jgi:hypothetical protein
LIEIKFFNQIYIYESYITFFSVTDGKFQFVPKNVFEDAEKYAKVISFWYYGMRFFLMIKLI